MFKEFTEAGGHAIEVTTGSHTPGQNLLFAISLSREIFGPLPAVTSTVL